MKQIILLYVLASIALSGISQQPFEGVISYTETLKIPDHYDDTTIAVTDSVVIIDSIMEAEALPPPPPPRKAPGKKPLKTKPPSPARKPD